MKGLQPAYYASVVENRFKGAFEGLYTAGPVEKNQKTAEEKLLCLHRQVFKVVKIAGCQVRTCTRKSLEKSFKHTQELQKQEVFSSNHSCITKY